MIRVFLGLDARQPIAFHVACSSIIRRASVPVQITPLVLETLPVKRRGLSDFTFSRFLVPHLCNYEGQAIFMDADVLVLGDVAELLAAADPEAPVSVSKNKLQYEWPSVMVFNNALCKSLTPELIETGNPFSFEWASHVGELPPEWNHLSGYDDPRPDAKLVHFTQGIPCFPETKDSEYAGKWNKELNWMNSTVSWAEIMGTSVHKKPVMDRLAGKAA